jgi:hypothetical protein
MMAQFITLFQIWMAIAAEGYRLQPLTCYYAHGAPYVCWMPLRSANDYSGGWLTIQTDGAIIRIEEHSPEGQ